jgi:hypothetical protein
MSTIRELAAILCEQAVAIDLGRRLLQEAVDGRQVAEARADKAERELAEVQRNSDIRYKEWRDMRGFVKAVRKAVSEDSMESTRLWGVEEALRELNRLEDERQREGEVTT